MERKLLINRYKVVIVVASFFMAGFFYRAGAFSADAPVAARSVNQFEATVIHVDQYAVYAPNRIFYFDTQMDRQKVASLAKMADQLRNKKAVITYSAVGDPGQDKHALLLDIVAAEKFSAEKIQREAPNPPAEPRERRAGDIMKEEMAAKEARESQAPQKQTVSSDTLPQKLGQPARATITREEVTAFVRRLLELNEKKDLPAIMQIYADQVDYYDRGVVPKDNVRRDLGYYFRNWDKITTSLDGDVVMIVLDPDVRTVKFKTSFAVKNDKKALAGKTENIWKIQRINGQLKLIDVKQTVISKETPGL